MCALGLERGEQEPSGAGNTVQVQRDVHPSHVRQSEGGEAFSSVITHEKASAHRLIPWPCLV